LAFESLHAGIKNRFQRSEKNERKREEEEKKRTKQCEGVFLRSILVETSQNRKQVHIHTAIQLPKRILDNAEA
jgi:hypothetical protein